MKLIISAHNDKDNVFFILLLLANHTIQSCGSDILFLKSEKYKIRKTGILEFIDDRVSNPCGDLKPIAQVTPQCH